MPAFDRRPVTTPTRTARTRTAPTPIDAALGASIAKLGNTDPRSLATSLVDGGATSGWLDEFVQELSNARASGQLAKILEVWKLSQAEFAGLMGVSRQAVGKWLELQLPTERAVAVADLAAATELLVHYVQRDRIAAVVRRPAPALNGRSLVDLVRIGDTASVLQACRAMFDPANALG